jgi:putative methionine-R-sulfoxide reductase with GAF domain
MNMTSSSNINKPAISIGKGFAAFWSRLGLARKLLIAFGALALLALLVGVVANIGMTSVQTSYRHALEDGGQLQTISLNLSNDLLTARRHEKDYLLRWQDQGFDKVYADYAVPNHETVVAMLKDVDALVQFAPTVGETFRDTYSRAQYEADLNVLKESINLYDQNFQKTVQLIQEKGYQDVGLEGEFRAAVHAIENRIYDRQGLEPLTITMLQIRRHEKDYLLRGDQTYIDQTHESVVELKRQISASELLTTTEKQEMRALSDQYAVAFDALVAKNVGIAAAIEEFRSAAHTMEPIVAKLAATGSEMSQIDAGTAQTNSARTLLYSSITLVAALVGAILLSVALSRQITAPVRSLTNTALEIAGGTLDVQAEVSTADEIGTLAQTFNTMTQRLGEAFEEVRRRAAELATVADVSTATATILESKRLLQEVVDLTKERFNLYHSHIYLLDKKGENLLLTAGAGEPGRVMVAEGRSIPLNREQSLVARAARERKGVTVNDVIQAPDFLPHPLLPDTRSELAVPMIAGGNVIGVFDIQSEQVGRFTDSDVNIQTTLAAQLAVSIQNVRSFEESRKQAEFESLVNVIGQKIQRTTSIEETLQTAIRELGTAIGASRVKANLQPVSSAVSTEATSAG